MAFKSKVVMVSAGIAVAIAIAAVMAIYATPQSPEELTQPQSEPAKTIIIGTVHDNAAKQITRFQPTADYIASKMGEGYAGKVIIARDADGMAALLKNQEIDLYFDSPFIAASVAQDGEAVPLLIRWKEGVEQYHSVFIVRNDSSIMSIEDLAGNTLAFESPSSTSGYLLPASYLLENGLELTEGSPEGRSIGYEFSGDDENTALWVAEGRTDAGAFSNIDLLQTPEQMMKQLRVIARTDSVPRQVVLYRADMNPEEVQQIKEILLEMEMDEEGQKIMDEFGGTTRYTEAPADLLEGISQIVARVKS